MFKVLQMVTNPNGITDLLVQLELSWVQFLEGLSLTDLHQNPEEKVTFMS